MGPLGIPELSFIFVVALLVFGTKKLPNNLRYAILIIFVLAAVITPTPDIFNMILFATPMIMLLFVGIGASRLFVQYREKRRQDSTNLWGSERIKKRPSPTFAKSGLLGSCGRPHA